MEDASIILQAIFDGKLVCLTGESETCSRAKFMEMMSELGVPLASSASRKVACLVTASGAKQSKIEMAKQNGIPIISFDDFIEKIYTPLSVHEGIDKKPRAYHIIGI